MKNARTLHHEAMDKLRDAEAALELGNLAAYKALLTTAFDLESEAAYFLRDKFQAEPTRSVLFRSAAALALRCDEFKKAEQLVLTALTGNVPYEIKSELLDVFGSALAGTSQDLPIVAEAYGGQEYTLALRAKAVNFKVVSKGYTIGTAVRLNHAINVMRNVRMSYTNYLSANYRLSFGNQEHSSKYQRILNQSLAEELLISDLKQASFGFSVSADVIMTKDITTELSSWKSNTFEAFKHEVINLDYNSLGTVQEIANKYTAEELRGVYGPIVSMLQESNAYVVSITNPGFTEVQKTLKPITKAVSSIVVPKIVREDKGLKLYQAVGLAPEGSGLPKESILDIEEIEYMTFNRAVSAIHSGKSSLYFFNEYSLTIEYNSGTFSIESDDFKFRVESSTHKDILGKYGERLISTYKQLVLADYESLSLDERLTLDRFEKLVSMANIE